MIKDKEIAAKALRVENGDISLLKTSILSFPLARLRKLRNEIAKVLVLIPPPVDPGEAPIHMRIEITRMLEIWSALMSIELNPAVRGVVALKNAEMSLPAPL